MPPKKGTTKKNKIESSKKCGLCGKSKKLIRTECCNQWICDDESEYVLFSYADNCCSRNHRRYTLCGFHATEEHEGTWQDCAQCRNEFETEMYVWYGTNKYNFEKLPNPPSFKPKYCGRCHKRMVLAEESYSQRGEKYYCEACTHKEMQQARSRSRKSESVRRP